MTDTPREKSIAPAGDVLIACDAEGARVIGCSDRLGDWVEADPAACVDAPLRELVGAPAAHALRNGLARALGAPRPALLPNVALGPQGLPADIVVRAGEDCAIFALAPAQAPDPQTLDRLRAVVDRLSQADSRAKILKTAARLFGVLGGWDAAVVAHCGPDGFTAVWHAKADWPGPERQQELLDGLGGPDLTIVADFCAPEPRWIGAPLDFAALGCAGPTEAERRIAQNCGTRALFRAPLRAGGRDCGLLAGFHRAPKRLSLDERGFSELFVDFCALNLALRAN